MDPRDRTLLVASGALLSLVFITGGSSQETGWGVMAAELLALAVLLFTLTQARWRERIAAARWPLAVGIFIVAIPLLQLLPIPAWLWQWPAPRAALQHDLAVAGITTIDHRWSLAPAATERDAYLLLPGLALFVAALALRRRAWHALLWWLMGLAVFSMLLAFVQMNLPQESFLNPFPQYAPALTGVFANRNHQACALAIALVLAMALLLDARARARRGTTPASGWVFACAIVMALTAAVLPLVGSRAGVVIAIVGAATTLLAFGAWSARRLREQASARWLFVGSVLILCIGLYGAFAWMQQDADVAGSRWQMAKATIRLATASLPLGGGAGSFVRMFEQFTRGSLMHTGYINAAHNDYLQWWFAGGVLALIAMLAVLAILIVAALRVLQLPRESRLRGTGLAALLAIVVPLLHSTVDYPLRTPALMSAFAMLCGIAVGAGISARTRAMAVTKTGPAAPFRPTATFPRKRGKEPESNPLPRFGGKEPQSNPLPRFGGKEPQSNPLPRLRGKEPHSNPLPRLRGRVRVGAIEPTAPHELHP